MAIYRQCKANTSNIAAVIRTAAELFACLIVLDRTLLILDIKNVDNETAVEPLVIDAIVLQYCVISYMHIGYIAHFPFQEKKFDNKNVTKYHIKLLQNHQQMSHKHEQQTKS